MAGAEPSEEDLRSLGLYDPDAREAAERLELIRYLVDLGATTADLVEYRDELPGLGTVILTRPGRPELTPEEVAERAGLPYDTLMRLWRAAGFPDPPENTKPFSEADLEMLRLISGARELFGEEAVVQLARVIGSAMGRIADAAVSAFLVNIEVPIVDADPAGLAVARANVAAASLLPGLARTMDILLRRHILAARRSLRALQETGAAGFEVQNLTVGFVDLVGSTALAQQLPARELGRALSEFEGRAADTVVAGRGRLVKLIGDEVMFVAGDPVAACEIALDLTEAFGRHPVLPPVRAGLAAGDVLTRDGDCFGPVVNLAARAVKEAPPDTVTVAGSIRDALGDGYDVEPLGERLLKGLDAEVALYTVRRR